jgi:ribosome biogenesis ATPase
LTELDGLDNRKAVYVIGATNRPDMIDPAMVRPGRLDKLLYVDLPSPSERFEVLKTHTKRTPIDASTYEEISSIVTSTACDGYSGADIAALVREASALALKSVFSNLSTDGTDEPMDGGRSITVSVENFREAAKKTRPSVSREQKAKYERLRDRYAGLPTKGRRLKEEGEVVGNGNKVEAEGGEVLA